MPQPFAKPAVAPALRRSPRRRATLCGLGGLLAALAPVGAAAQGPWGEPGWGGPGGMHHGGWDGGPAADDRSGTATAAVFRAPGAEAMLGHGRIAVVAMAHPGAASGDAADGPGTARYDGDGPDDRGTAGDDAGRDGADDGRTPGDRAAPAPEGDPRPGGDPRTPISEAGASSLPPAPPAFRPGPADPFGREQATYEAAVLDRLAHAGYATALPRPAPGGGGSAGAPAVAPPGADQIAEIRVTHALAAPADPPHKAVSGEMSLGVSNRGSGMGFGLNIDLSKPRGPVIATRLEVRIRDAATGRALWEGRADIATRAGDARWSDDRIAGKLAAALFAGFPRRGGGS